MHCTARTSRSSRDQRSSAGGERGVADQADRAGVLERAAAAGWPSRRSRPARRGRPRPSRRALAPRRTRASAPPVPNPASQMPAGCDDRAEVGDGGGDVVEPAARGRSCPPSRRRRAAPARAPSQPSSAAMRSPSSGKESTADVAPRTPAGKPWTTTSGERVGADPARRRLGEVRPQGEPARREGALRGRSGLVSRRGRRPWGAVAAVAGLGEGVGAEARARPRRRRCRRSSSWSQASTSWTTCVRLSPSHWECSKRIGRSAMAESYVDALTGRHITASPRTLNWSRTRRGW